MNGKSRGSDHQHPRGTLPGGCDPQIRRARGDRQRRNGRKDAGALTECGAVYLNGIDGAAQYYARMVEEVLDVNLIEFGIPEAMWHIRVRNFAAIVTMDAHGNSLHKHIEEESGAHLATIGG
jgi:tartrate dehydratase beta subunit/fumarate hydratase class I family protein